MEAGSGEEGEEDPGWSDWAKAVKSPSWTVLELSIKICGGTFPHLGGFL